MSPEQLLGKDVDARTDVYAAGMALYEMATGRRPFGEASGPQLVAKILSEAMPPPRELNPELSPQLEQVILKAADKDKELRYQTAKELLIDLERLAAGTGAPTSRNRTSPGPAEPRPGRRTLMKTGVAAAALIAVVGAAGAWMLRPREPRITATRVLVRIEPNGLETDGVNVYYSTSDRLMAVPLEGGQPRRIALPWTDDLALRSIRRDAPMLLLKRGPELWRVPLTADAPTRLDVPPATAAAWSPQGDRLAWIEDRQASLVLCVGDAEGANRRTLVEVPKAGSAGDVLFLVGWHPSGRWLRYLRRDGPLVVDVNVDGTSRREAAYVPLPDEWSVSAAWTPDGAFFVFGSQRGMVGAPGDGRSWWPGRNQAPTRLGGLTHAFIVRFTPDGRKLVAFVLRPSAEILRFDKAAGAGSAAILDGTRAWTAAYSPDGSRVAWVAAEFWPGRLWIGRPDGTERLPLSDLDVRPFSPLTWSPDGRLVAFTTDRERALAEAPRRLYLGSPTEGTVEPLTTEDPKASQADACWSPDGRWLAYGEVPTDNGPPPYIRRVELATRRVTKLEGSDGLWSPRCAADGRMLAMDWSAQVAESRSHQAGKRHALFKVRDPAFGRWSPLAVELPPGGDADVAWISYPSWSRDGRHVYGNARNRWLVRFDVESGRLEVVADLRGFGTEWPGMTALDREDNPLITRDLTQREIVVMDLELR
jgi:Tol biopolymer transport system component